MTLKPIRPGRLTLGMLPERKSYCRGARIEWHTASRVLGTVTTGTKRPPTHYYRVTELPVADRDGRAFTLEKLDDGTDPEADAYTVFLATDSAASDSCECRGFLRWGYCKHLDGVRLLLANEWWILPAPAPTFVPGVRHPAAC